MLAYNLINYLICNRIELFLCLLNYNLCFQDADFSSLINKPSFMDKTMLVKSFLENRNKNILVAAPRRSGRTTNLLMLKNFLEISVDENGNVEQENKTFNYKLFKDNHLNIFEHGELVQKHFGKYPVVYVNCRTLGNALNYRELVTEFREIVRDVFTQHKYLLHQKQLWLDPSEKEHFENFFIGKMRKRLNSVDMIKGFTYLAEVLQLHFGKPAILLLDDYDILAEALNTDKISDKEQITKFLKTLYASLLKNNRFYHRAFLTGVFKVVDENEEEFSDTVLPYGTASYSYMDDITLCKFFRHVYT